MNAYLSTKFAGEENEEIVAGLCSAVERAGFAVTCTNRDFDDYGRRDDQDQRLTDFMFQGIDEADVVLLDVTDKGIGLGIEAGYAIAHGKPIVVLHAEDADVSRTLAELASRVIVYHGFQDLTAQLEDLKTRLGAA